MIETAVSDEPLPEEDSIDPEKPGERGGDFIQDPETGLMNGSTPSGGSESGSESGDEKKKESEKKKSALSKAIASKDAKKISETIINNPDLLAEKTPKEWKSEFEKSGYKTRPLSQGSQKGKSFEDGGGWKANLDSERLIMYHPAGGSHHGGAYYKVSSGNGGTKRYDEHGKEIP